MAYNINGKKVCPLCERLAVFHTRQELRDCKDILTILKRRSDLSILCYDSVTASNIPSAAAMVGGYIDGRYAWSENDWTRFPNALKLHIITNPAHNAGDVYDCEPGNGFPSMAGPWAKRRNEAGVEHPCIYCSNNEWWPLVKASVLSAGATGVVYWIADYFQDGQYHPIPGAVGVQYTDIGPYDLSIFTDVSWMSGQPTPVIASYKKKGIPNGTR